MHRWDDIRARERTLSASFARDAIETGSRGFHESLFRCWSILEETKAMLARGDSPETIATFIEWAQSETGAGVS